MNDSTEAKRVTERSPTFPFISLERAIDRARQFFDEEKRGVAPFTRVVRHWKYSEASSGALQTVSALKSYGLLEDAGGSGMSRQLKLTPSALRILLDQRPGSVERTKAMREAAVAPKVISDLYNQWPDGLPNDGTVHHFLVFERKFTEETATKAVKILKENQGFAKPDEVDIQSSLLTDAEEQVNTSSPKNQTQQGSEASRLQQRFFTPGPPVDSESSGSLTHLALNLQGVAITITFTSEPTFEVYEYLEKYACFQKAFAPKKTEVPASTALESSPS